VKHYYATDNMRKLPGT